MNMITETGFNNALWRKSSRSSASSNCVEVAMITGLVGVRDSKNPDKTTLTSSSCQWKNFIQAIKNEKFDL
jgi:Domain of unknown function (DUF397)